MSISAMKQALEALEGNCTNPLADPEQAKKEDEAIAALRQAIAEAEKQEPVFYVIQATDRFGEGYEQTYWEDPNGFPVYATPVHASDISQECVDETAKDRHEWGNVTDDALIEEVRRRGFPIRDAQISPKIKDEYELCCQKYDTCTEPCTPRGKHLAKRELVGLTDGDIAQTMHGSVEGSNMLPYQFARAIEAKLKEKNT